MCCAVCCLVVGGDISQIKVAIDSRSAETNLHPPSTRCRSVAVPLSHVCVCERAFQWSRRLVWNLFRPSGNLLVPASRPISGVYRQVCQQCLQLNVLDKEDFSEHLKESEFCLFSRCLTQPPVPSAAPSSCSVSFTRPERWPSASTRTAAWASSSGAFAGQSRDPEKKGHEESSPTLLSLEFTLGFHLWRFRLMWLTRSWGRFNSEAFVSISFKHLNKSLPSSKSQVSNKAVVLVEYKDIP